jgi:trehalose 2-sulfotransferase
MVESSARANRGYAICTSPRSGSNLFGQYLSSTGVLGKSLEYFNGPGRRSLGYPDYPDDPTRQIDWILSEGATPNGIYAVKIFPMQFDEVQKSISWTQLLPNLSFVLLKRRDLLGQAISAVRAEQTRQYRSTQVAQGVPCYDGANIQARLQVAARDYARWELFFARKDIVPITIVYEEMLSDPQAAVDQVAQLFGLRGQARVSAECIDLQVQRDTLTDQWRARFLAEYSCFSFLDTI